MPGRSTIDQIFALRQIIEKFNEHNRTVYIAFDSIDRISIWYLIRISGTPPKLCRLLELLYSDSESCVRVGNDLSEWFSIASGVRQGCVVPPDLFNCVIDHLMCQLKTAAGPSLAIDLDNWRLTDMDDADDIALFSPSSEDLSSVLRILSKEAAKVGTSISWTKTKAMMISPSSAITTPMNIDGEVVEYSYPHSHTLALSSLPTAPLSQKSLPVLLARQQVP